MTMTTTDRPLDLMNMTLVELGEVAASEARMAEAHALKAVEHAMRCGEVLLVAKDLCDYGEFGPWLDANFPLTRNTATKWMRLAFYKDEVPADVTGWAMAVRAIAGLPALRQASPPWWVPRALAMKEAGYANRTIARDLGVDVKSVKFWTDPTYREQERKRNTARHREERTRAARLIEADNKRKEMSAAASRKGGSVSKLYGLLRQQQATVAAAIDEAGSTQERLALEDVARAMRRAEQRLADALKSSRQYQ